MYKLKWDVIGTRLYETGVDKGVLFPMNDDGTYRTGVAWSGLTACNESPSGAEPTNIYADNIKYLALLSAEDFALTIEALMYPDEFAECNGSAEVAPGVRINQQQRRKFGFSYRSWIGNDTKGNKYGEKIHIVYNGSAKPSEKQRSTVNETPDAPSMSWEVSTTPMEVNGYDPTAHLEIDSTKISKAAYQKITEALWGTENTNSKILTPDEVVAIINEYPLRSLTQTLTHCTSSYTGTTVDDGFETTIAAEEGYEIDTVSVTMGEDDITSTAYTEATGKVAIATVTGDVTITATATVISG